MFPFYPQWPKVVNDRFTIVVAFNLNNVIGIDNKLPWSIPEDMVHFRNYTVRNNVIMGRKTYESIGKPLPNRRNVVVSRNLDLKIEGVEVVPSLQEALTLLGTEKENCLIGGGSLYKEALDLGLVSQIMVTEVMGIHPGDTYFPKLDMRDWDILYRKNPIQRHHRFVKYQHKYNVKFQGE